MRDKAERINLSWNANSLKWIPTRRKTVAILSLSLCEKREEKNISLLTHREKEFFELIFSQRRMIPRIFRMGYLYFRRLVDFTPFLPFTPFTLVPFFFTTFFASVTDLKRKEKQSISYYNTHLGTTKLD